MFFSKRKTPKQTIFKDETPQTTYEQVVEYLEGLSTAEYIKVIEVADIYRKANDDAAKALKTENKPTTFIDPPSDTLDTDFLDDMLPADSEPKKVGIEKSQKPKGKK